MSDDDTDLGPVFAVLSKKPAKGGILENVHLRRLGDRQFIVGQLAARDNEPDPRSGLTFWFAFDQVVMLTEYPDLRTAQETYDILDSKG